MTNRKFKAVIKSDTKIKDALSLMKASKANNYIAGFLIIINSKNKVLATLTDGDIRRGIIKGISLENKVIDVANKKPLLFEVDNKKSLKGNLFDFIVNKDDIKKIKSKYLVLTKKKYFL